MAALRAILAILSLSSAHSLSLPGSARADDAVTFTLEPILTGGFHAVLNTETESLVLGQIGRTLVSPFTIEEIEGGVEIHIGTANLTVHTVYDAGSNARGIKVYWEANQFTRLEDCFDFGSSHWYGGPMQIDQTYPLEKAVHTYAASYIKETDNGAIDERYWLNSNGQYIIVNENVPLFVDYTTILSNHLCLGAQLSTPYSSRRPKTVLAYDIWFLQDAKAAHKHAVANYLGKPSGVPDYRIVQHPIWSTWAQYSRDINNEKILEYANQIQEYGFNNAQLEIDDQWEVCYGSMTVNEEKFPNFTQTIQEIKAMGFRVTIWIHPFINKNCEPWYSAALNNNYFVVDESGSPDTTWWNNNGSIPGYIDFTNPSAAKWWSDRLRKLLDTYDIDSVKFDATEPSFAPEISVENSGSIELQPHNLAKAYVETCATFGDMIEVRSGFRTQKLPIFVRMVDRDSIWGLNNGLPTIITTTIQMNLNGYPFVLPDMIGGNGYNLDHDQADLPTAELFIRWVQANTFLPVMQFSFAPWNFGEQSVEISKKYSELHAAYADLIYGAMEQAVVDGTPVNTPLWWLDPTDEEAQVIWDEYLLAETILVAPVLVEGATSRDIYLPAGTWYEEGDESRVHEGPVWIKDYPAPIHVLPYFVRDTSKVPDSGSSLFASVLLVLCCLLANILN